MWCAVLGTIGIGWTTGGNIVVKTDGGGEAIIVSTWRYVLGVFVVLGSTYVCMPSSDKSSGGGGGGWRQLGLERLVVPSVHQMMHRRHRKEDNQ